MTELPTPAAVSALAERLAGDLASLAAGAEVTVTASKGRRWRVTAASDRVTMWIEVEPLPRRRLKWQASEFWLDGVKSDRRGYEEVLRTFADPDGSGTPLPVTDVPIAAAPDFVAKVLRMIERTGAGSLRPSVQRSGNEHRITLTSDRIRLVLRMRESFNFLRPSRDPSASLDQQVELWIDGVDRSDMAGKTIASALAAAASHIAATPPPSISREAPAAVNTGVQVRKTTVIRN